MGLARTTVLTRDIDLLGPVSVPCDISVRFAVARGSDRYVTMRIG